MSDKTQKMSEGKFQEFVAASVTGSISPDGVPAKFIFLLRYHLFFKAGSIAVV